MKANWKNLVKAGASGILLLALTELFGYLFSINWFGSHLDPHIPMAPLTAFCMVLFAVALLLLVKPENKKWEIFIAIMGVSTVIVLVVVTHIGEQISAKFNIASTLFVADPVTGSVPLFRISPATKIILLLEAIDILIYTICKGFCRKNLFFEYLGGLITLFVLIFSYVYSVSYLYSEPFLESFFGVTPMAISTAISFIIFSISILIVKYEYFPVRLLLAKTTHGILLRFILPLVLAPIILIQVALFFAINIISDEHLFITTSINLVIGIIAGWIAVYISKYIADTIQLQTEKIDESEKVLMQSEEKFRFLFDTMDQGVVLQDKNGKIIDANPAASRILGLTSDQLFGRSSFDPRWKAVDKTGKMLRGDDHPAMLALASGKEISDFIMGVFNPVSNETKWILVNAIPWIKPNSKEPVQVFATFLDITALKKANEENRKLQDGLEIQIKAKTKELNAKIEELENFYNVTIERELRMEELRQEIEQLKSQK